jgi:hypothetical protein
MPLSYSYVPGVPQGNQQINNTQNPIKDNFYDIYDLIAVNHVGFNVADTFGRHNLISYIGQATDPSTSSNDMALYSKSVTNDSNGLELFYRYPNNGNIVQLTGVTNSSSSSTSNSGASTGGTFAASGTVPYGSAVNGYWQYLYNGVLLKSFTVSSYISTTPVPTSPFVVTFPSGSYPGGVTVPAFSQTPFNIQIAATTPQGGTAGDNYMYSVEIVDATTALVYYQGDFVYGSTTAGLYMTVIGI